MTTRREIIFEHLALGPYRKCTAIDAQTAVEVTVSGPLNANPKDLEKLATSSLLRKLS